MTPKRPRLDESFVNLIESINTWPKHEIMERGLIEETIEYFVNKSHTGFSEGRLNQAVLKLLGCDRLTNHKFGRCLWLLMPESTIAPGTIAEIMASCNMLLSPKCKHSNPTDRCRLALQYVLGLLKFGLIDAATMKPFYFILFAFFRKTALAEVAANLIYYSTTPRNLTNWNVLQVRKMMESIGKKGFLTALLALFKRLRPDLVVEDTISETAEAKNLHSLPTSFENLLEATRERIGATRPGNVVHKDALQMAFRSSLYGKLIKPGASFQTLAALVQFYQTGSYLEIGTSYSSVLRHKYSFALIALMPQDDLANLNYFMRKFLIEVARTMDNTNFDAEKQEVLSVTLKQLLFLPENTLHLRKELKLMLTLGSFWILYTDELLAILPLIPVKSYAKFLEYILHPLYLLFISSHHNQRVMRKVLETLSEMIRLQFVQIQRNATDGHLPRLELSLVIDALKYLSKILLNLEPLTFENSWCVLESYKRVLEGELLALSPHHEVNSVLPVTVAQIITTLPSVFLLDQYAQYLLKSLEAARTHDTADNGTAAFYIEKQMESLASCLLRPLRDFGSPLIYPHCVSFKSLQAHSCAEQVLNIPNNVAFWPYTHFDADENWTLERDLDLERLKSEFPSLAKILSRS